MSLFISYSHKDKDFVLRLYHSLRSANMEVFLDEKDILIGDDIPARIEHAIEKASAVIYVISKHSVTSKWVRDELSMAKVKAASTEGLRLLLVLKEDVAIPMAVSHLRYADFRLWQHIEVYFHRVGELLETLGIQVALPHTDALSFAMANFALIVDAAYAFRAMYHQIGALVEGFHAGQGNPVCQDVLMKQAYDNSRDLGLLTFVTDLQQKLIDSETDAFGDLRASLQEASDALTKLRNYLDAESNGVGQLYDSKRAYATVASYLEWLERSISLQSLALVRAPHLNL